MGKRLYCATTYNVSYENSPVHFDWKIEQFHNLIAILGIEEIGVEEGYEHEFEIEKDELEKGIEILKNLDKEEDATYILDGIEFLVGGSSDEDVKQVVDILQKYIDCSDNNNHYVHFCFF